MGILDQYEKFSAAISIPKVQGGLKIAASVPVPFLGEKDLLKDLKKVPVNVPVVEMQNFPHPVTTWVAGCRII